MDMASKSAAIQSLSQIYQVCGLLLQERMTDHGCKTAARPTVMCSPGL